MFRIQPQLPPVAMKTYAISAPRESHWREAPCSEVGCLAHENGWESYVDESTPLGQRQAYYIRRNSGRGFKESRNEYGITVFSFGPGQECFQAHQIHLDRPEFYLVRGGDWRGNPRGDTFQHSSPDNWVEDFAEHQDGLAKAQE